MDSENCIASDKIKKENPDEDIHEFAETAMNELLGWYGYGGTREESKMPRSCQSQHESNSSEPESPKSSEGCEWCGKPVDEIKCLLASGASFCSELCFSQSRRANFKKNKTCDWCRHVRHTVSYVDFQDGASQLQFCSDKCLNQYKMHIFCRETRAHLQMHPHLPEDATSVGGLITPDLWLRNCKSPDRNSHSPSISPQIVDTLPQSSPIPLIRVAHPSKMMPNSKGKESPDLIKKQSTRIHRRNRKRSSTTTSSCMPTIKSPSLNDFPQDLRVRHTPPLNGIDPFKLRDEHRNEKHFPNAFRGQFYKPPDIHSKFFSNLPPQPPPPLQPHSSLLPPVTVLVPYPIIIPLPLPIPIPIPITSDGKFKLSEMKSVEVQVDEKTREEEESSSQDATVLKEEEEKVNTKTVRKRKRITVDSKIKLVSSKSKKSVPV